MGDTILEQKYLDQLWQMEWRIFKDTSSEKKQKEDQKKAKQVESNDEAEKGMKACCERRSTFIGCSAEDDYDRWEH